MSPSYADTLGRLERAELLTPVRSAAAVAELSAHERGLPVEFHFHAEGWPGGEFLVAPIVVPVQEVAT